MKKTSFIVSLMFFLLLSITNLQAEVPLKAENITTDIKVTEEGKFRVTQEVDMYFNTPHQGIFISVPQRYEDVVIDDTSYTFQMPISDINILSDDMSDIDQNSEGVVIRLGEPDVYVEGNKTYKYQYDIQMYPFLEDGLDVFYFDLIGNGWEFPIENVDFSISFPQDIENDVYFYATKENKPVNFTVDGNTITGNYSGGLNRQALTMETTLGVNYFDYPNTDFSHFVIAGQGLFLGFLILIYYKYGKDFPVVDTVEFGPPEGLSSADVAYIYKGSVSAEDVISLIIFWASQCFLVIEELENKDEFKFIKVKEMEADYPAEERRLFNALFKGKDEVISKDLDNKFGVTLQNARQAIPKSFQADKEQRVFSNTGTGFKVLFILLFPVFSLILNASLVYSKIPSLSYAMPTAVIIFIGTAFIDFMGVYLFDNGKDERSRLLRVLYIFIYFVIFGLVGLFVYGDYSLKIQVMYGLFVLLNLSGLYFIANMSRRTRQGTHWFGRILGLRRFIDLAEKDRLERLAEETPTIFYDILPFAFVLGVTDVWTEKFKDIAIEQPEWYRTTGSPNITSFYIWSSLNRQLMHNMKPSLTSVPAPKSQSGGGGSGFGGGSGGGGGFSGGGFGGGGGGGW